MPKTTEFLVVSFPVEITYEVTPGKEAILEHIRHQQFPDLTSFSIKGGFYSIQAVPYEAVMVQDRDCFVGPARLRVLVSNLHRLLHVKYRHSDLWGLVRDCFGVGSNNAAKICRAADYAPYQSCKTKGLNPAK
jgi:hypothetical protein